MVSLLQGASDPAFLAISAALAMGCAGIPGLFLRTPGPGQVMAAVVTILASLAGIPASLILLFGHAVPTYVLEWGLPFGSCELAVDPLSAFFLLPVFLVSGLGALFALGYWPAAKNRRSERGLTFFYGLLASSMAILLMARNSVFFLMVWEIMALSAYFLLATEHGREDVRHAGIIYLIATHAGTAALFVYFSLLFSHTGSFLFPPDGSLSALTASSTAIVLAAFVGFGAKGGIMPLHIWLPSAHANAPSHVSAMMSGVMLKMGLYGIFRALTFFREPPLSWGGFLVVTGIASALLGISFAIAQRDLKRLLACSSIENIGIITTGLGIALMGISSHNTTLAYLGMAGSLLHLLNHSLFKPLLFLGSGVIIHASGTRDMNLMGGLAKGMPKTAFLLLLGSIAICGIPPLNGFVSEFLLYLGFFSQLQAANLTFLVLLAPLLALVGGLALIAFTKLYCSVFLGTPRSRETGHSHEAGPSMLLPLALLALLCLLLGLLPQYGLRLITPALVLFVPPAASAPLSLGFGSILGKISFLGMLLLLLSASVFLFWRRRLGRAPLTTGPTWGCGYQRPTPRIQYTASSFSEYAVSVFNGFIRQRIRRPALVGLFPGRSNCVDRPTETLLDRAVAPLFTLAGMLFAFLLRLQHGRMHVYMIYIFATLLLLMLWAH
jgi:hydrogenase-4 component B